ncbi:MAG: phosphopyruvate hydratase, partial [Hyphomicrobium sp.]
MSGDRRIEGVRGRRVWDSRGLPALEVEVSLAGGRFGIGAAPAAGLAAPGEPVDRRDGGAAFGGQDVVRAICSVDTEIARALVGLDAADQDAIDRRLIALDRTDDRRRLGGNAMLATSLAIAHAAAAADNVPLWQHLACGRPPGPLPLP